MKCPYCSSAGQGRCATATTGRSIMECSSCGRVVEERQTQNHHLFHVRAQDTPLCLVTSDLQTAAQPQQSPEDEEDPFEPTGFITAFSTWSLEPSPLFFRSSLSFSGYLAELERTLELASSSAANSNPGSGSNSNSSTVVVDNLRAYMQIIDVASILGLDCDISEHAFQLFRDCCSATCLRNRSVEALATACLVQAIREAQEPRTLQEISIAANVPQKEIGKYIKILGEALQLSQPINSNSISVHMPRFCTLLQLNKSAQELATHIGEVVINKCFCTRRNPISISAAAIYLACQLEDKRKTQAEICKVTGLTEVTLRKVYKELLENWDDLLPSNYTPAVPPEKAFPTTNISTARSTTPRAVDSAEANSSSDRDKPSTKPGETFDAATGYQPKGKEDNKQPSFRQPWLLGKPSCDTISVMNQGCEKGEGRKSRSQEAEKQQGDPSSSSAYIRQPSQYSSSNSGVSTINWSFRPSSGATGSSMNVSVVQPPPKLPPGYAEIRGGGCQKTGTKNPNPNAES
ncbi:PREDICTED: plant-specific TFIIB-related protein 1 [Tarenaya hassleriana]|uniref:plant-specific TFIIB-related protein 1 n=1 Tax=Tarenaya hassleriana TaxID=28532 RepID=UPI00053C534A|nr:PREDICTED: plant-specific TFIIB-related protein 1 [Tarenaya hassleriana]XP_010531027.1 PREDICTED: plant-specific TFIIB-related protein 1 [Tarenaya hassleriana]XP_010531028.1 PREDICTED: plant-specific TFIIB-related protein 1 [Tarenaya hassleriana]